MTCTLFIGTYTEPGGSRGIYRVGFDPDTGELGESVLAAETSSPSFLARHPVLPVLYCIDEGSVGSAGAYRVEGERLEFLNEATYDGAGPCHISIHPDGRWAFVSAYVGGQLVVLHIHADGSLGEVAASFLGTGSGPNAERQERPHMHFAMAMPQGDTVWSCDLGTDEIRPYRFDSEHGSLVPLTPVTTSPGSGPRHLCGPTTDGYLFGSLELSTGLISFSTADASPAATEFPLAQLDPGLVRKGLSGIRLHPSGRWVVAAVVPTSQIACCRVGARGELMEGRVFGLDVSEPRDLVFDASGRWLLVAGKGSGEVASYRFDEATGFIGASVSKVRVARAACILQEPLH